MMELLLFLFALLAREEDEDQQMKIISCIVATFVRIQTLNRIRHQANQMLIIACAAILGLRNDPSGAYDWQRSPIFFTIYWAANDLEFKRQFRISRPAFEALVNDLSPWIKTGKSRNKKQNICTRMKVGVALYYFAQGGSGQNLAHVSGLSKGVAFKYVHQIAKLIRTKIAHKWMSDGIFQMLPNYMEECRSRFHSRHAFPNVGGCIMENMCLTRPIPANVKRTSKITRDGYLCCVSHLSTAFISSSILTWHGWAGCMTRRAPSRAPCG